jgi:hypothetical protein
MIEPTIELYLGTHTNRTVQWYEYSSVCSLLYYSRLFKTCSCLVQESNYIRVAQRTMGSSSALFLSHFVSKKCTSLDQSVSGVSQRY